MAVPTAEIRPHATSNDYEVRTLASEGTPILYSWEVHRISEPGVPILQGKLAFTCPDRARFFANAALELWLKDPARTPRASEIPPINRPARS